MCAFIAYRASRLSPLLASLSRCGHYATNGTAVHLGLEILTQILDKTGGVRDPEH